MAWLVLAVALWLGSGWAVWRWMPSLRPRLERSSRTARGVAGIGLLLASGGLLIGGMIQASASFPKPEQMDGGAIAILTLAGMVFVVLQCLTAMILLSFAVPSVTISTAEPSKLQTLEGNDS